ncbi:MAG: hypothetical protein WA057_04195 [Candidatus Magasanikiibacteriota bacterium]
MTDERKKGFVPDLSGVEEERVEAGLPEVVDTRIGEEFVVPQTALPAVEQYSPSALELINGNKGDGDPTQPTPKKLLEIEGDGGREPSYGRYTDVVPQGAEPLLEQSSPNMLDEVSGERNLEFYANRAEANIAFLQNKKYGFNTRFIRKMLFEGTRHALGIIEKPEFMDDPANGIRFTSEQLDFIHEDKIKIEEAVIELIDGLHHLKIDTDHFLGINADNE